jgi:hypothetical protein
MNRTAPILFRVKESDAADPESLSERVMTAPEIRKSYPYIAPMFPRTGKNAVDSVIVHHDLVALRIYKID